MELGDSFEGSLKTVRRVLLLIKADVGMRQLNSVLHDLLARDKAARDFSELREDLSNFVFGPGGIEVLEIEVIEAFLKSFWYDFILDDLHRMQGFGFHSLGSVFSIHEGDETVAIRSWEQESRRSRL